MKPECVYPQFNICRHIILIFCFCSAENKSATDLIQNFSKNRFFDSLNNLIIHANGYKIIRVIRGCFLCFDMAAEQ